ncbi:thiazole/oxazole-forming peptide maturase, SagD family component [Lachnospiraceae bacterium YSD2013]|nr:thiazole/oxazole-forming peptide maturase, SagD family component [Lachnospiraceae bacterium YSD2013]
MITYYPYFDHIMEEFRHIGGGQGGILQGVIAPMVKTPPEPRLRSMTGNMPHYHKLTFDDPDKNVSYHISGYGLYNEEAFIRFMGESVERYAPIVTENIYTKEAVFDSYANMKKRGKVLPLEYINLFDEEQQKRVHELIPECSGRHVDENDIISWISCPSLIYPGENIWVPRELMFVGYVKSKDKEEVWTTSSFSTGTAAHRTMKKALINALTEYIQIDSFVISWYTARKCKRIEIDDETILKLLDGVGLGKDGPYEIIPFYTTLPDLELPTVVVILRRKDDKLPQMVLGLQGDMDIRNAVLRGIFESTAIINMNIFDSMYDPGKIAYSNLESPFCDLDTNVLFYGTPGNDKTIDAVLDKLVGETVKLSEFERKSMTMDEELEHLLNQVRKVSEYAVYLDITPPELAGKDWCVVRTLIPEICGMCFPGFPYKNHPRVKQYGGVQNEYPHPLP